MTQSADFARIASQLKCVQEELRQQEDLLQAVANATPNAVFVKDRDGKYLLFNKAASRFVGKPTEVVLGRDDTALFDPAGARLVMERDRRVMATGQAETQEEELTAAGVTRTFLATKAPYRNERGEIVGVIGISQDITERKQAEEALRASEQRFRTFVDHATDAFFLQDCQGTILDVNRQACESLGYTREELIGKAPCDLDPSIIPTLFEEFMRTLDTGKIVVFDCLHRRKDGSVFSAEVRGRVFWEGGRRFVMSLARDVTERKRADEALRESEQRYRLISELTSDYVYSIRLDHSPTVEQIAGVSGELYAAYTTEWITQAFAAITGYTPEEVEALGGWLAVILPDDRPGLLSFTERLLAGQPAVAEYRIRTKGGEIRRLRDHCRPVWDATEGRVVRLYGGVQDVSERRRLEDQYRQAQKMEAIGTLAGGVAHDFNNLLTVINGYSAMVYDQLHGSDPMRELIGEILKAGERAATLTRQLLAFSRKQILQPRVIDLNALVGELAKMLERLIGEDIELTVALDPKLGRVKIDPGQFEQVLMNLVVNARDAMPRGGRLTIETRNVELGGEYSQAYPEAQPGRYVRIAVSDTGHGMDEATRARIFEPFFTTKEVGRGTGLGLAVVDGVVRQSGGIIEVKSGVGHGTTFNIFVPIVEEALPPLKTSSSRVLNPKGSETVLLVDDDDGVRALVSTVLRSSGYKVLEARDGEEALRVGRGHPGPIHLLVTDVVMPQMSGRQLADLLAAERPEVKILFASGYTADIVGHHGVVEGGEDYLAKPFSPFTLAWKVREVLDAGKGIHQSR